MRILIAPDKFKHSLSSFEVCDAIKKGLSDASDKFTFVTLPLADGGDGLSEIISHYTSAKKQIVPVLDPLFRNIESSFLVSEDHGTVFIEMAKASGLQLLQPPEFNCMLTSTYGTGQLIKEAIGRGARKIILGIGGSATNDAGIGMAAALGYRFLDKNGKEVQPVGENLIRIYSIDTSSAINTRDIDIEVACDVSNPLTGANGASAVYGPQKGASPEMVEQLEKGMIHFAKILKEELGKDVSTIPGSGAAGGLGAGSLAFLNARLVSGIELALKYSGTEKHVKDADVVISGEGKIDAQTLNGKVLAGLATLCQKHAKPLIALCGTLDLTNTQLKDSGITSVFSVLDRPMPLEEAYANAHKLVLAASLNIGKVLSSVYYRNDNN
jgi:glycerate kinase